MSNNTLKENRIKKWKFFMNFLKERDWLEEMASQGFLLTNITMGMYYEFKKTEPCEKVFEVERFAVSAHPTVQELNARKLAIDVATQSGWEVVTHDEDMNYYFMKDKAGDETDEFYDDEELRRNRAERYRKHLAYEQPLGLLKGDLILGIIYIILTILLLALKLDDTARSAMLFYIVITTFEIACIVGNIALGQRLYTDFSLSREEWINRKNHSVKKRFKRIQHLRSFLQEQSEKGLSLTGYDNGHYLFEKDTCRYNYYVDTKSCLKKRLKEQGIAYEADKKNMSSQDLNWYEMSISEAAAYGLKPVAVVQKHVLIYKRPYSDEKLPWENGNAKISHSPFPSLLGMVFCIIGFFLGFLVGMFLL
uniref:DUF2812 domain-containing protein n=1 Tax=Acetatifactor sp. TaxID=1872090 RepID=UPI0040568383